MRSVSSTLDECFNSSDQELEALVRRSASFTREYFGKKIFFSIPSMVHFNTHYLSNHPNSFPSISVTGNACSLNCDHCGKRILDNMISSTTPHGLYEICRKIKETGGKGCLISGGAMQDGSVPLKPFIPTLKRVKKELGITVAVHTGIVYPETATLLAAADIDAAMIDIIGSEETAQKVCHLNVDAEAYDRSLFLLEKSGIPSVPHVLVGIHYGQLRGERKAIEIISSHKVEAVVVIALNPLPETRMERATPPSLSDIMRVLVASRLTMPQTPLVLGCMKPSGLDRVQIDTAAVRLGVNGIAYPSEEAYNMALEAGLEIESSDECCALIFRSLR